MDQLDQILYLEISLLLVVVMALVERQQVVLVDQVVAEV
jgi:hypothetical protein